MTNNRLASLATELFAAAALIAAPTTAHSNLIVNGSFEQQSIPDGGLQALTPTAWTGGAVLMNPNAAGGLAGNPFTWPQPADGQQYEDIGNESRFALTQSFSIGTAGSYLLTWLDNTALNIVPGFQTAPYSVSILDAVSNVVFSVLLDSYHANGAWTSRNAVNSLDAGQYTIAFTSLNQFNRTDTLIDAVSLVVAPAVVPEPSTLLLLFAGLFIPAVTRLARLSPAGDRPVA